MAAHKAQCCYVRSVGSPLASCTAEPEYGFLDGDPMNVNYACADHLGHVLSDERGQIQVWPLEDGYDPTLYSADDIKAARAAAKKGA